MARKGEADNKLGKVPDLPLEVKKRVHAYVETVRAKKASSRKANSYFTTLRTLQDDLERDLGF